MSVRGLAGAFLLISLLLSSHARARTGCEGLVDGKAQVGGDVVRWRVLNDDPDELRPWCLAVGAPVIIHQNVEKTDTDRVLVVSWNVDVGAGRLDDFMDDLRAGKWTHGEPVSDYVLLLQEAYRSDDSIPPTPPEGSRQGNAIHHGEEDFHQDVVNFALKRGLILFYVPLMRNGDDQEDRGNAILSTFPMSEFSAFELPLQRQRRVAQSAMISGHTSGRPWSVRLINIHLENRGRFKSPLSTFGSARQDQVSSFLDAAGMRQEATIMGGDFNVWYRESNEGAIRLIRKYMNMAGESDNRPTVEPGKALPERRVDYLFYSPDRAWNIEYQRVDERYESDHHPILIRITPAAELIETGA